jgi:hypothetical protein
VLPGAKPGDKFGAPHELPWRACVAVWLPTIRQGDIMPRRFAAVAAVLALTLAGGTPAAGQGFGVKGGMVSSNVVLGGDIAGQEFWDRKTGLTGGVFVGFGGGPIGVQLEAIYSQKGIHGSADVPDVGAVSGEWRTAYVEVPLLLKLAFPAGRVRPYGYVGPSLAIELMCEFEVTVQGSTTTVPCDDDEVDEQTQGAERRTLEFGAVAGAGLELSLGALNVLIEGRYARGLQSLDSSDEVDIKNDAFSVLAGISIPMRRPGR